MTVKELKEYLKNFKDTDEAVVGMWSDRRTYFTFHQPCTDPFVFYSPDVKSRVAAVGFFDYCRAHIIVPYKDHKIK